ncbi:sensor histidine kinase [Bacillus sp. JJ1521]|uniref:sensor histidine kinase n=1 Tax=Bacillus sp. JJ1521 TaxID=3122957 RepID=UPI002FFE53A0
MRWKHYLFDQRFLLFTFSMALLLTSMILILDPNLHIHLSNLLYLLLLMILPFSTYLLIDFRKKKRFFQLLREKTESGFSLEPSHSNTYEQRQITQLLKIQSELFERKIEGLKNEQKEWHEYTVSWVHEIKTPISVSKMLFETEHGSKSLEEEIDKIDYLVDQALNYARVSNFSKDYFIQELNVEHIIKESIKGNRKVFLAKNIKLVLDLSRLEVLSDKKGLLFILNQILSNSLKYTPAGGEITVQINKDDKRITIRDNGIGIVKEDLVRIFDKGFTGKNGRQFTSSTGMGLYLVKKTADKLELQLFVDSIEGSYTEVSISFSKTVDLFKEELDTFMY